jgi:hypothetical protein
MYGPRIEGTKSERVCLRRRVGPAGFKRLIDRPSQAPGVTEEDPPGFGGHRLIILLYVVVVSIAGLMGGIIGSIGLRDLEPVTALGLVTFQPTPLGLALFGMSTVGAILGVVLGLVVFVSRRYADA